jgi:ubiquinone biosynthesis protein COQ9
MTNPRTHAILSKLLPLAAINGWTKDNLQVAASQAGETTQSLSILMPHGITSAISTWQHELDAAMLAKVKQEGWQSERTRDKIAQCVWTRLELIGAHHDAFHHATRQRLWHPVTVKRDIWHSADAIWNLVGDASTDYNHYTKRALLSKLLFKTTLSYLGDTSPNYQDTRSYLTTQIEQIIARGQKLSSAKPVLNKIWNLAHKMGVRV